MPKPARAPARGRSVSAVQALALLVSFALMAGVGGVLVAGLALPAVGLASGTADLAITAFDELPSELDESALPEKSEIYASDGTTLLATFYTQNRVVVPLSSIAPTLQHAVIATEDKRFYEHAGVDPAGMLRAFTLAALQVDKQGASTLTQQYVKNVLIEDALSLDTEAEQQAAVAAAQESEGAEGYARKLREAKLAIALEKKFSKDQILEKYLNIAAFGASVYGVETAANYYFSKSAADVTYLEAATIAGITQSPTKWDPVLNPEQSQSRRNLVLRLMHEQGYITDEEYTVGIATPLADTLHLTPVRQGCMMADAAVQGSGFFCDYVTKVIKNDPAFGADEDARKKLLYTGGLKIVTTLDANEQRIADAEVKAGVPVDDPSGIASSIVTVEPGTGRILAMAQNRTYTALAEHTDRETNLNYNVQENYGGSSGFAPGSTFKPFTLVEWLKQGHSLTETFDGRKKTLNLRDFTACGSPYGPGTWSPGNAEGAGGIMNALKATQESVNSAYLAMAQQLDLCNIMQGAADLGVHQASAKTQYANVSAKPSSVIGSDSVAPLAMAGAFAAFASGGMYCAPIAIASVTDAAGNELAVPSAGCEQKLEPRIANAVNYALSNVWKGTASAVGAPPFPAAGKTGTTSENEQTWFVGYTPLRATAVWVGYPDSWTPMQGVRVNGKVYRNMYGSSVAGPTWKRYMTQVLANAANPGFAAVGDKELNGEKIPVPSVVGKSEADARAALTAAGFKVSVSSSPVDSPVPAGNVATQTPTGRAVKGSVVVLALSTGVTLPAEAAPAGGSGEAAQGGSGAAPPAKGGGNNGAGGSGNGGQGGGG